MPNSNRAESQTAGQQSGNLISVFRGITPKPIEQTTWAAFIEQIRNEKHPQRLLVEKIRKTQDKAKRNALKGKLRAVTFGGVFPYRKNSSVEKPTCFIISDIDHIKDVARLLALFKTDPLVWFAFRSPSGDGIKVGIRTHGIRNDADHKTFFAAVERYFLEVYGIKIDPACKDIARLTYTSFDLDAFINSDAEYFDVEAWAPQPTETKQTPIVPTEINYRLINWQHSHGRKVLENACNRIKQSVEGGQHHERLKCARLVGGYIIGGYIDESEAMTALERAVSDSGAKNMNAAMKTIQDGIEYGKQSPIILDSIHSKPGMYEQSESKEDAEKRILGRKDFETEIDKTDDFEELTETIFRKIKKSNQTDASKYSLFKKIAKKAEIPVKNLMGPDKKREESGPGQQIDIVEKIIEEQGRENVLHALGSVWMWRQSSVWKQLDDREVKKWIQDKLKNSGTDFDKNFIASLLDLFKTETYIPDHRFNVNRDTINTLNGELSWTGEKWELHEARRESYRTTQIPIEYDLAATAPQFIKALNEMFRDDPDRKEKILLVCEMFGYCLLSSSEFEKFFMMVGPGANGKSVLLSVLVAFLGVENVSAVLPGQLDNKFQRAHLHGKLANVVTELAEGTMLPDAQMKSITSGESMTVENKFKSPFDFEPFSTLIFATNHLPHTRDFSEALFRRAIIIPFNRVFSEKEQDKQLAKKLKSELPGILNLALAALAGVFKRGYFTEAASVDALKKLWRIEADQAAQFIEDRCVREPGYKETSQCLFDEYRDWAMDNGINKHLNKNNFIKRIVVLGGTSTRGTGGLRGIAGFRFRQDV